MAVGAEARSFPDAGEASRTTFWGSQSACWAFGAVTSALGAPGINDLRAADASYVL